MGGGVYRYNFPSGTTLNLTNSTVAITSCSIYNSLFNIKDSWQNNKIVIFYNFFITSNIPSIFQTGTTYTDPVSGLVVNKKYVIITIPDGYYSISDLNLYMQKQYILLGLYSSVGSNFNYYSDFQVDPVQYKTQIDLYPLPASTFTTIPMNMNNLPSMSLPSTNQSFFMYFPSSSTVYGGIGAIFGFPDGKFLPNSPITNSIGVTKVTQFTSSLTPNVSPISTYIFTCNMVRNTYTIPQDLFFQLPINASIGSLIVFNSYPIYITALESNFQYIEIKLYDQFFNSLNINDSEMCLTMSIQTFLK
jgi:hypothetical protein